MEPAWAKLNLSLDVLGARSDGFHDLRMVMQSVDLHDDVTVTLDDTGVCRAETNRSYLPCGADNVAVRAAQVFLSRAGLTCGVHIRLHKRIPVCAGLGGGSSDAAAVLRALERLTGAGFTRTQLEEMGAQVGSDVPYCVAGGTMLAEGRGERLTPVTPMPRMPVVICKPDFPISTPELFHRVDARTSRCRPDTEGICAALADGDMPRLARRMYNVFEDVLTHREGEIVAIKSRLLDGGALGAVMVRVMLLEAEHRPQLRDRDGQHIGKFPQHRAHVLPAEQLRQFTLHALRREILQQRAIAMDGRRRLRRDLKAEHGRKAQRAQDAQPILLKAAVRLAHAAHNAARNVLRPAADVDQPRARIVGQRVHREIAAQQILAQAARKAHGVRPPVVGIVPVDAVGRDLKRQAVEQDGHGAVPEPRLDEPLAGKDALDLCGLGIGRDVPIPRRAATQRVAHSPADDIGLPARRRETIERRMHL